MTEISQPEHITVQIRHVIPSWPGTVETTDLYITGLETWLPF